MKWLLLFLFVPVAAAQPATAIDSIVDNGLVVGIGGGVGIGALAGLLYYLGVGGLRHIDKKNVLEHPLRQSLLETVQDEPGIHLRELAQRHDTAVTNTQWHLRKLQMAGLVNTQKSAGKRLYYPVAGGVGSRDAAFQNAALRNENAQQVVTFLEAHPGASQRQIATGLKMNPGTVRWHLRKLQAANVVRGVQEGNSHQYFVMQRPMRPPRPAPTPRVAVEDEA